MARRSSRSSSSRSSAKPHGGCGCSDGPGRLAVSGVGTVLLTAAAVAGGVALGRVLFAPNKTPVTPAPTPPAGRAATRPAGQKKDHEVPFEVYRTYVPQPTYVARLPAEDEARAALLLGAAGMDCDAWAALAPAVRRGRAAETLARLQAVAERISPMRALELVDQYCAYARQQREAARARAQAPRPRPVAAAWLPLAPPKLQWQFPQSASDPVYTPVNASAPPMYQAAPRAPVYSKYTPAS